MLLKHCLKLSNLIYSLTSHIDFDLLSGVISKGGIDSDGNFGSPLIAANVGTHTLNICETHTKKKSANIFYHNNTDAVGRVLIVRINLMIYL